MLTGRLLFSLVCYNCPCIRTVSTLRSRLVHVQTPYGMQMAPVFKKASTHASSSPPKPTVTGLVPVDEAKRARGPERTGRSADMITSLVYTSSGVFSQVIRDRPVEELLAPQDVHEAMVTHVALTDNANDGMNEPPTDAAAGKKERQWLSWSEGVIPSMIQPYLKLLRESENLRKMDGARAKVGCTGCGQRRLGVSCIYFERRPSIYITKDRQLKTGTIGIEKIILCTCKAPALQLLAMGLFPCAPSEPSLAVDLNMLDFLQGLFVNSAPNVTAWCKTLESFLSARNFKLTTRVRKFNYL